MPKTDLDIVRNRVEQALGRELLPDEFAEIQIWDRGKRLQSIVNFPGWDDVVDMLTGYVTKANDDLKKIEPWKREDVLAGHAVVYAADQIVSTFLRDVQLAIQAERPASLEEAVRRPVEA